MSIPSFWGLILAIIIAEERKIRIATLPLISSIRVDEKKKLKKSSKGNLLKALHLPISKKQEGGDRLRILEIGPQGKEELSKSAGGRFLT